MKKAAGYLLLAVLVLVVLGGVYFFISKGYSGNQGGAATVGQNINQTNVPSTSAGATPEAQELGSTTSGKISLVVTSPTNGATLGSTNVTVTGKTLPGAEVFVNDQTGKADASGNFSINVGLDEGENQLVVNANDGNGNVAEQDLTVNVSSFQ